MLSDFSPAAALASPVSTRQLVLFHLADCLVALPLADVARIVPMAELACPPGLPPVLQGVLNFSGEAIPVLRLDRLFGLATQKISRYSQLVILNNLNNSVTNTGRIAILADRVRRVLPVATGDLRPVGPDSTFNECAEAAFTAGEESVHLLSLARLMLARERRILSEFRAMEQERLNAWNPDAGKGDRP